MAVAVINAISNEALRMARSSGEVCTRSYEFDRDPAGGPSHPPSRGSRLRTGQGGLAVPVAIIAFTSATEDSGRPDPALLFASDDDWLDIDLTVTVAAQVLFGAR